MFRTHEDTGRKAVYVNRLMTVGIEGMPQAEAEPLLEAVFDHAEKPEFVYEHVWRVGDLLLWDNRCSSHARRDFPSTERRLMLRTTVKGSVRPGLMSHARGDCVGGCNLRGACPPPRRPIRAGRSSWWCRSSPAAPPTRSRG